MASLLSGVGFISGCGGASAYEMTPAAMTPTARVTLGEGKIMRAATKRAVVVAAGLAAAGLFGSLPYDGSPLAQQGAPVQHHDVALVDVTDASFLLDEGTLDNALFNDVLGPTGAEEQLFSALATATSTSEATALLDAAGATPIYSGDFNGAESRAFEALFLDGLVAQDQLNQLLGVTETASQAELLSVFNTDFVPIPDSAGVTATELAGAVGTSAFDTDLTSIANADFGLVTSDLEGYLMSVVTNTYDLGDYSTLLTDLTASFSDLSTNLTGDLNTVLTDATFLLGSSLDFGSILGGLGF